MGRGNLTCEEKLRLFCFLETILYGFQYEANLFYFNVSFVMQALVRFSVPGIPVIPADYIEKLVFPFYNYDILLLNLTP